MRASEITPKPIEWLWWPFVPLGKLTSTAGQMGQAKSLWTTWLAAETTTGGLTHGKPGSVIVLNAEDDAEDTIRPRLEAAGADLERVWIEPGITLDAHRLAQIGDELGDVRLITVDPLQAFLPGNVNSWKGQDVRRALEPLRQLAAARKLAIVFVQHLNRRADATDALARIGDSQSVGQLARSVLVWGPDPSDPEGDQGNRKALTRAKANLARPSASATYVIEERTLAGGIQAPVLIRGNDRAITSDEVVTDHESRTAQDEAAEWLRELLADGPVPAKELLRQARDVGIADRTLKRAKKSVGAVSRSARDKNGFTGWAWSLPNDDGPLDTVGPVGPLGQEVKGANKANSSNGATPLPLATPEEEAAIERALTLVAGSPA